MVLGFIEFLAPPTGFEPVTNGLLQWTFHFNSFSLSPRAESAALPLSSRPQTSEGTAARVYSRRRRPPRRTGLLKDRDGMAHRHPRNLFEQHPFWRNILERGQLQMQ